MASAAVALRAPAARTVAPVPVRRVQLRAVAPAALGRGAHGRQLVRDYAFACFFFRQVRSGADTETDAPGPQALRHRRVGCRASADAAAPPAPAAGASFFAGLLKRLKLFATNLAIDAVRDKEGILRLAKSFPPKVQSTFIGLFECYVEQVGSRTQLRRFLRALRRQRTCTGHAGHWRCLCS